MGHLLGRTLRSAASLAVLLGLNFLLPRWMPGDPIVHLLGAQDHARYPELVEQLTARYGLDRPLSAQFGLYLKQLAAGDLGVSYHYRAPVGPLVCRRLLWSLVLVVPALALGGLSAIGLGAVAGWRSGTRWERWLTLALVATRSIPQYGLAMLALYALAFGLEWFPLGGLSTDGGPAAIARCAALPVLVLGLSSASHLYLVMRNGVADLRSRPFVTAARARGLAPGAVLGRHVLPNALLPFVSLFALGLGFAVAGALLVEIVFSWPGMGTLILAAVDNRDYPLLQGAFLAVAVSVLAANWVADLALGWLDPRLRRSA